MKPLPILIAAIASSAFALVAAAHVFWVQPSSFTVRCSDPIKIQFHVGDTFPGEIVPRKDAKIDKFVVIGPKGEEPATGKDGDPDAAAYTPKDPGTYLIAYRGKPSSITLEPEKFEAYLAEKGLEKISQSRAASGRTKDPGREIYSRSAKAVFRAGDSGPSGAATKDMYFRVEIIPKADPSALKPKDKLSLTLKSEGKPFENALVNARSIDHPETRLAVRTDAQGRAAFLLPCAGIWVIDAVDMFPAPKDSGADWESVWASLTFEIAAPPPATGGRE